MLIEILLGCYSGCDRGGTNPLLGVLPWCYSGCFSGCFSGCYRGVTKLLPEVLQSISTLKYALW